MRAGRNGLLVGAAAMVVGIAAVVYVVRPAPVTAQPGAWDSPGLYPPAGDCLQFELERSGGGAESLCITDAELGAMVREMGAICTQDRTQLRLAVEQVKEQRRLHGVPTGGR